MEDFRHSFEKCINSAAKYNMTHTKENNMTSLIKYTKKLLNSDWLRTEKCNTSVTQVQFCGETLKNVSSNEKKWLQERSSGTSSTRIFSCLYF